MPQPVNGEILPVKILSQRIHGATSLGNWKSSSRIRRKGASKGVVTAPRRAISDTASDCREFARKPGRKHTPAERLGPKDRQLLEERILEELWNDLPAQRQVSSLLDEQLK